MNKGINTIWCLLISLCFVSSCQKKQADLTIVAAANTVHAVEELATSFERTNKVDIDIITGSSGKLYAQIKEGAPFDVFISADTFYPDEVALAGKAAATPRVYAIGRLVLYADKLDRVYADNRIITSEIDKFVIANPETAPYGKAAVEYLKNLEAYTQLQQQLIFGESIGQVNQFLSTGASRAGITSLSSVISGPLAKKENYVVLSDTLYNPLTQSLVILNPDPERFALSTMFVDFILSPEGQEILSKYGYLHTNEQL